MGCRENDIIFGTFAKNNLSKMNLLELSLYAELIMRSDSELFAWITGQVKCESKFQYLLNQILDHTQTNHV
jgi:succinate dehydrogenase flavin-adding protein (antitoxin of CptAB toxin-antitoxin module)